MTGAWTLLWLKKKKVGRQGETNLSFVKVSKVGKKQAEDMAEPDLASSHFGCFCDVSFHLCEILGWACLRPDAFVFLLHD